MLLHIKHYEGNHTKRLRLVGYVTGTGGREMLTGIWVGNSYNKTNEMH
jgi:hypothetical protein